MARHSGLGSDSALGQYGGVEWLGGHAVKALYNTMIRGVFFLVPVVILAFVAFQVFKVTSQVGEIVGQYVPIERVAGVAVANVLMIVLALLLCLVAGLISYLSIINDKVEALDRILSENVPGYTLVKGVFGSATKSEHLMDALLPVLVQYEDFEGLAFEVERTESKVTLFRPHIPNVLSGEVVVVDVARVTAIPLPAHQVLGILQANGRKMSKVHDAIAAAAGD